MSELDDKGGFGIPPGVIDSINIPIPPEKVDDYKRGDVPTDEQQKREWSRYTKRNQVAKTPNGTGKPRTKMFYDNNPRFQEKNIRKRKSFPEFCRDFLGQNYGSIAQALLEICQNDKALFMKYVLEMGKQGYPQALAVEVNETTENKTEIYNTLQLMANPNAVINAQQEETNTNGCTSSGEDEEDDPDWVYGEESEYDEDDVENTRFGDAYVIDPDLEGIKEVEYKELTEEEREQERNQDTTPQCGNKDNLEQCLKCHKVYRCGMPIAHYALETTQEEHNSFEQKQEKGLYDMFASMT